MAIDKQRALRCIQFMRAATLLAKSMNLSPDDALVAAKAMIMTWTFADWRQVSDEEDDEVARKVVEFLRRELKQETTQ